MVAVCEQGHRLGGFSLSQMVFCIGNMGRVERVGDRELLIRVSGIWAAPSLSLSEAVVWCLSQNGL